jgi:autotransporter-associated beta strand protein
LSDNVTLTTTSNGNISFGSAVDGNATGRTLTISTHGTGDTTFTGAVGGTNALGNITISTDVLSAAAIKLAGTLIITNTGTISITGIISNGASAASLTKAGVGILSLTANNAYTGVTTISAGTLQLSGSGLLNNGSYSGNISIANLAILRFSSSSNQNLSGVISGDGSILLDGTGELTLSGSNSLTGGIDASSGTLKISSDSVFGTVPGSFDATNITLKGGTLEITSSFTINAFRGITLDTSTSSVIKVNSGVTLTYNGVIAGQGN